MSLAFIPVEHEMRHRTVQFSAEDCIFEIWDVALREWAKLDWYLCTSGACFNLFVKDYSTPFTYMDGPQDPDWFKFSF